MSELNVIPVITDFLLCSIVEDLSAGSLYVRCSMLANEILGMCPPTVPQMHMGRCGKEHV